MSAQKTFRFLGVVTLWACGGFVLTTMLAGAIPLALGDRSYVVRSGSMAPAIDTGDVVVTEPISPLDAEVGQIVTFDNPEAGGALTSHRAITIDRSGDSVRFTTKGDSNTSVEHWSVAKDGEIGKVLYRVPKLGFVSVAIQTPTGRIALVILPAILLAATGLARIWRGHESEEGAADDLPV
ncbi:MAG: signal peptidase [Solirubrobacterales bacterium]|jgi:signal peptidase|nr:signal peptidase [Solirubrobacterales bacterium]